MNRTCLNGFVVWILITQTASLDILIILRGGMLCYCLPLFYLASIIFIHILHFSSAIFVIMIKSRFHANILCMLT